MFVDDSGNTRPHRAGADGVSVHILSSLVVHEHCMGGARDAIDDAKRDIFAGSNPRGKELHAYDMWNNRGHFSGAGRGLDLAKKKGAFSRTVGAIAGSGASLVSVVVWKNLLHGGFGGPRIRALAWRLLAERFEAYLAYRGGRDLGLIISDSSGGANEAGIRDALAAVSAGIGRRGRYRSRVMEDVIFKDSRRDLLIQGADVAAYVIRKHCYGDPLFASWHAGLEACMWSIGGRVNGLGIKNYPVPR